MALFDWGWWFGVGVCISSDEAMIPIPVDLQAWMLSVSEILRYVSVVGIRGEYSFAAVKAFRKLVVMSSH